MKSSFYTISNFKSRLCFQEVRCNNKKETVKNLLFKDFNGSVKSLGAWGGDFVLACGQNNLKNYFKKKGFDISYSFNEMIK